MPFVRHQRAIRLISSMLLLSSPCSAQVADSDKRLPVDPCQTVCAMYDSPGCFGVKNIEGKCNRLYWTTQDRIEVSDAPTEGWRAVEYKEALDIASSHGDTCQSICLKTPGCRETFCKDNSHCKALFWEDVSPPKFCFHRNANVCKQDRPVLCREGKGINLSKDQSGFSAGSQAKNPSGKPQQTSPSVQPISAKQEGPDVTTAVRSTALAKVTHAKLENHKSTSTTESPHDTLLNVEQASDLAFSSAIDRNLDALSSTTKSGIPQYTCIVSTLSILAMIATTFH